MPPGLQNVETQNQRLRWVFFPTSTRVSLSYARIQSYPPHHRITKKKSNQLAPRSPPQVLYAEQSRFVEISHLDE